MGRDKRRKSGRDRPIPLNIDSNYKDKTSASQKKAISLLRECLVSHNVNNSDRKQLLSEVLKSLGLPSDFFANEDSVEEVIQDNKTDEVVPCDDASIETPNHSNPNRRTSSRLGSSSSNSSSNSASDSSKKSKKFKDQHNEFCDVCNTGGELVCCDTCSLVFHISCIRPKIIEVPKGRWSCVYCIVDDLAQGDVKSAKKSIKQMKLLSKGLDSDDESESKVKELSIVKSGSKYVSRCTTKKAMNELGRYNTLHEALISTEQCLKKTTEANEESKEEPNELWCTHCIDDPEITICAFCGCQICLGKHDSDYLIICDGCDAEIHTYCLNPPLKEIPAADKWYCSKCVEDNINETAPKKKKVKIESIDSTEKSKLSTPKTADIHQKSPLVSSASSASASKIDPFINYEVVGVDNALILISNFIKRGCTDDDKHFFEVFRQYCTYNDMLVVLKALEAQRDIISSIISKEQDSIETTDLIETTDHIETTDLIETSNTVEVSEVALS